jgi:hypothetical protein
MKKIHFLAAAVTLAGLMTPKAALADGVATASVDAPSTYTYGQTSDTGSVGQNTTDSTTYTPGQEFELTSPEVGDTGSYNTGVELDDVYIKSFANSGKYPAATYTLTIGTVSDINSVETFTPTDTETFNGAQLTQGDYLTFQLADYVQLEPGTEYAFTLSSTSDLQIDGTKNPAFTPPGGFDTTGDDTSAITVTDDVVSETTKAGDRTFYLETSPVPEPADWALVPVIGTLAFFGLRRFQRQPVLA